MFVSIVRIDHNYKLIVNNNIVHVVTQIQRRVATPTPVPLLGMLQKYLRRTMFWKSLNIFDNVVWAHVIRGDEYNYEAEYTYRLL